VIPHISEVLERLQESEIAEPSEVVGCSEVEIQTLGSHFKVTFPLAYQLFLKTMGHRAGRLMTDISIFYKDIFQTNVSARQRMVDYGIHLPQDAFVFASRRDEQVLFFLVDGGDDPPVYHWIEEDTTWKFFADSIWEFVESEIRMLEAIYRQNGCSWKNFF